MVLPLPQIYRHIIAILTMNIDQADWLLERCALCFSIPLEAHPGSPTSIFSYSIALPRAVSPGVILAHSALLSHSLRCFSLSWLSGELLSSLSRVKYPRCFGNAFSVARSITSAPAAAHVRMVGSMRRSSGRKGPMTNFDM